MKAPVAVMNEARVAALAHRGDWLAQLRDGLIDLPDLLMAGRDDQVLGRTRLETVLQASFATPGGSGASAAARVMTGLGVLLDYPASQWERRKTVRVSWLFDRRAGRRRLDALTELVLAEQGAWEAPWPGFPLAPPTKQASHG